MTKREMRSIEEMIAVRKSGYWQHGLSDFVDGVDPIPGSDEDTYIKGMKGLEERCNGKSYLDVHNPRFHPITGKDLQEKLANLKRRQQDVDRAEQDAYWEYKRRHSF